MSGVERGIARGTRRWRFASAEFDEERWLLIVDGRPVPMEPKPLELLRVLLLRAGAAVSKDELLEAVWPGISVVEASLSTAVLKLRKALGDEKQDRRIIETVPRIGYRLAVPVELVMPSSPPDASPTGFRTAALSATGWRPPRRSAAMALLVIALGASAIWGLREWSAPHATTAQHFSQRDVSDALRRLDLHKIDQVLRAGWNPNERLDKDGSVALGKVAEICEWAPDHNRQSALLMARALLDGGARIDVYNKWGDTPYSIAKATRYCGPDHPVTRLLHAWCYTSNLKPLGDKCLATYEQRRHQRGKG